MNLESLSELSTDAAPPERVTTAQSPKDVLESLKRDLLSDASNRDYRPVRDDKLGYRKYNQDYGEVEVEENEVVADRFWTKYLDRNKKYDKEQIETWKGDADGILIFTGLFSATVAAFIVESYKLLQPDSGDATIVLLSQLVAIVNGSQPLTSPSAPFSAPRSLIDVNILWFFSLILSLTCALGATLVQQWTRNYSQAVFDDHSTPRERGRLRAFLFAGVKRFRLPAVTSALPLLLHISVFLFFSGIVEFLLPINRSVAICTLVVVGIVGSIYAILTILPLLILNCPYHTPLTPFTWPFLSATIQIRDLFRTSSFPGFTFRDRARNLLWIIRNLYSSYQSLDEYLHNHRSVSRAFGVSDVDALSDAAMLISNHIFDGSQEAFAQELSAVVECSPTSPVGTQAVFQMHADVHNIYAVVPSLLFLARSFGSPVNRDWRSVILVNLLSCLNFVHSRSLNAPIIPISLPMEVRRSVPHILQSTQWIFDFWRVGFIRKLSRHKVDKTATNARGVFGLAVVAALQSSLSQDPNIRDTQSNVDPGSLCGVLGATFRAHTKWMHFMTDGESSLANGPCIAALCVLSDLDDGKEGAISYLSYFAHLHTLALLSTLSPYVENTAPEVRAEFMRKWEELKSARPVALDLWAKEKRKVATLLKPLYDALQASQASSSHEPAGPALDTVITSPTAPVPPPEEQDRDGQDIEMGHVVRPGGNSIDGLGRGREFGSWWGWMLWRRDGLAGRRVRALSDGGSEWELSVIRMPTSRLAVDR